MGVPGYLTRVRQQGTATPMTDEEMLPIGGSTKEFQIADSDKQVWVRDEPVSFEDGDGNPLEPEYIDYLFGKVRFASDQTEVRVSGQFYPLLDVASARSYSINQSQSLQNATTYVNAQSNGGFTVREGTILESSVSIGRFEDSTEGFWESIQDRKSCLIEIQPGGPPGRIFRGWFVPESSNLSGEVEALEADELTFQSENRNGKGTKFNVAFGWS